MPPGNGRILDPNRVTRLPADGHHVRFEAVHHFALSGNLKHETTAHLCPRRQLLLAVACPIQSEHAFDLSKADVVGVVQYRIRHGHAVHPTLIRRTEIFEDKALPIPKELRVMAGDRRIVDLDHVVAGPADRDKVLAGELVRYGA